MILDTSVLIAIIQREPLPLAYAGGDFAAAGF
jgi:uncharacterized protein with PIN domain